MDNLKKYFDPYEFHQTRRDSRTLGQVWADRVSTFIGSWKFIGIYMALTIVWTLYNTIIPLHHFDNYPYIFYTFSVSVLAILLSSVILLSQNRQSEVDRDHAENAYEHVDDINIKQDQQLKILQSQNETAIKQHQEILELLKEFKNA